MKQTLLICAVSLAALSSCTTAYKSGQTPDDVYYSPLPKQEQYTNREEKRENRYDEEYYDDRYLRMKVRNRYQWNDLNDWYAYERWGFGHNYYWGSYYNPYNSWNYFYNPYSQCPNTVAFNNPKLVTNQPTAKPRVFNVGTYSNTTFNNNSVVTQNGKTNNRIVSTRPIYNNTNTRASNSKGESGFSRTVRTILSGNENNNNRTYTGGNGNNNSSRTYTPSSSSSSSSSSSGSSSGSSSSGGASRPSRN